MIKNTSSAFKISIIYLFFSLLWIYFSDNAINFIIKDPEKLQFLQTIKGLFFVTISSILLYLLSKQFFVNLQEEKDKLSNTNNILENIIENAPIIIFWKDRNGVYKGSNKLFLELMNLKDENELLGKKDSDFNIVENEDFMSDDAYVMTNKKPKLNYTETISAKNNDIRIVNTSKVPLLDEKDNVIGVLGVIQDITSQINNQNKLKEHELLLIQQSKLASMGEMIANIAHQWRQPLSIISTSATGIKIQKELGMLDDDSEIKALDCINENAQYLSNTIEDFRDFFKKSKIKSLINLDDLLEKTLKLILTRLKNKEITIVKSSLDVEFETYEREMIQVIMNIINNSIDAFENKDYDKFIFFETKKFENKIVIKIKDNAGGIDEHIINRIFEPYFTTKESKQGTGIGLYMCNEIIVKHLNGKIFVVNESFDYLGKTYKGSQFTIEIPLI
ncbi:MAG: PAS domain-containing sensor histidine kinase [Aliarcobacter sp.]|nr:PAS domain-containing sensor histidine kinase [Aliarcobacter sp.]